MSVFRNIKSLFLSTTQPEDYNNVVEPTNVSFRAATDLFDEDLPKPLTSEPPAPEKKSARLQQQQQQQPLSLSKNNNNANWKKTLFSSATSMEDESLADALSNLSASRTEIPDDFSMGNAAPRPDEKDELPDLLDDDQTLYRARELSDMHLIQYLSREDVLLRLVHIVTKDFDESQLPQEESDERRTQFEKYCYKFPYIASELLISTVGKTYLLPKIVNSSNFSSSAGSNRNNDPIQPPSKVFLMDELFRPLEGCPMQPHLARNYIKLLTAMIRIPQLSSKVMNVIYHEDGKIFKQFILNSQLSEDVCEFLLMCLFFERDEDDEDDESDESSDGTSEPLSKGNKQQYDRSVKQNVIEFLATLIHKEEYCENVAPILTAIVTLPRPSHLIDCLLRRHVIELLVKNILSSMQHAEVFSEGMDFLGTLIANSQQGDPSVKVLLEYLNQLVEPLKNPIDLPAVRIPSGTVNPPLGVYRLKIIEFFVILFKDYQELCSVHSDVNLKEPLIACGILPTAVKLFFDYPQNNILHNLVTHMVQSILEKKYLEFIDILFEQCNIVARIVEAFNSNKQLVMRTRSSLGCMGHVTIIENLLSNIGDKRYVDRILGTPGYNEISEELKEQHYIEMVYRHGGHVPLPKSFEARRASMHAELQKIQEEEGSKNTGTDSDIVALKIKQPTPGEIDIQVLDSVQPKSPTNTEIPAPLHQKQEQEKQEVVEGVKEEIKEVVNEEVNEKVKEEIKEVVKESINEVVKEEMKESVNEEVPQEKQQQQDHKEEEQRPATSIDQ